MLKRGLSYELFSREPQSSLPPRPHDTSRPVELTPLKSPPKKPLPPRTRSRKVQTVEDDD